MKRIEKLNLETKRHICKTIGIPTKDEDKEKHVDELLLNEILDHGVAWLVGNVPVKLLKEMPLEKELPKDYKTNQAVCKYYKNAIRSAGVKEYVEALKDDTHVDALAEVCGVEEDKKKERALKIKEAVISVGIANIAQRFDALYLRSFCKQAGLKVSKDHTKAELVTALAYGEVTKATPKEKKSEEKVSKKKPEIKNGISKTDLQSHYYYEELKDWCKNKDIPNNGSKKELIRLIIKYFESDENVDAVKKQPKKRKAKKAAASPSKKKQKTSPKKKEEGEKKEEDKKDDKKEDKKEDKKPAEKKKVVKKPAAKPKEKKDDKKEEKEGDKKAESPKRKADEPLKEPDAKKQKKN